MAGFKTHITVSSILGVGGGTAAYMMYGVPWPTCALAAGLCGVSGMLPDIDSDSGRPLHESLAFAAAVVPMMLLHKLRHLELSHELIILAAAGAYLLVRFGAGFLLKRCTAHRGMFHSLPAAAIFGEIAFLLAPTHESSPPNVDLRLKLFIAGAVVVGFLSHLLLDEIYSVEWGHGLRLKQSFGTALKLWSHSGWSNLVTYAGLLVLSAVFFLQPQWSWSQPPGALSGVRATATRLIDSVFHR
jgi:hypothetical protein